MSFQGQEFTKLFHLSFCVISLSCFCLPHVQIFQIFMQELSTLVTSTECLLWGEHAVVTGCKLAICNEQWNQLTTHNLTVSSAICQFHHWGLLLNQNHDRNLRQRRSVTDLGDDCCSDLWARSRWTQHHRFGECPRRQPPGRSGMFSWCSWCWDWKSIWFKSSNLLWRLWNYRLPSSKQLPKLLLFWRFWCFWTSRLSPCCHGTRQERFLHWHDMVVSTAVGLMSPEHVTVAGWFTLCHVSDADTLYLIFDSTQNLTENPGFEWIFRCLEVGRVTHVPGMPDTKRQVTDSPIGLNWASWNIFHKEGQHGCCKRHRKKRQQVYLCELE